MSCFLFHSAALRRIGYAVALMLPFCLAGCEKPQAVPVTTVQGPITPVAQSPFDYYYFNGQPSTKAAIENLNATTIARVDVLRGQQAIDYTHDANATSAVLLRTR